MGFTQFPATQYFSIFETNDVVKLGSFRLNESGFLKSAYIRIYINGVTQLGGSERIRLKVYSDASHTKLMATGEWRNISSITNLGTTNWLGKILLSFDTAFNMNKNTAYYLEVDSDNYTRNGDTFYMGLSYDFPIAVYDNAEDRFQDRPISTELFVIT